MRKKGVDTISCIQRIKINILPWQWHEGTNVRSSTQVDVVLADAHVIWLSLFSSLVYYRNHSIIFRSSFYLSLLLHSNLLSHFAVHRTLDALQIVCTLSLADVIFSRIIFTQCNIKYSEHRAQLMYTLAKHLRSGCISILTRKTNKPKSIAGELNLEVQPMYISTLVSVFCLCAPFVCTNTFLRSEIATSLITTLLFIRLNRTFCRSMNATERQRRHRSGYNKRN